MGVKMTDEKVFDGFKEGDIKAESINTDRASEPSFEGLECINCKIAGHTIPVWEDMTDYHDGEDPDYIGCTNCHTMVNTTKDILEEYYK